MTDTHHPYETITHYTCSFTIPDDDTTEVIIKTKVVGVVFASSPEDALAQTKTGNQYSHQSYASYILGYVKDNLLMIDRGGSVCLNRFPMFYKWISTFVMLQAGLAATL